VVPARAAASIILLRGGGSHGAKRLEVCLVRRSLDARFMPGIWVFPGGAVEQSEGDDDAAHRACVLRELHEEAGVQMTDPDALVPFSRWITPEAVSVRFDTWFYAALAPPHAQLQPDGEETVDAGWFSPADALGRHENGDLDLVFPTIKHLEALAGHSTAQEALKAASDREITPILPKLVIEDGEPAVKLPGEPGYPA